METISVNGWGGETGYRHGDNAWVGGGGLTPPYLLERGASWPWMLLKSLSLMQLRYDLGRSPQRTAVDWNDRRWRQAENPVARSTWDFICSQVKQNNGRQTDMKEKQG